MPEILRQPFGETAAVLVYLAYRQSGEGGHEIAKRSVRCERPFTARSIEAHDRIPRPVAREIAGEDQQPHQRGTVTFQRTEAQRPELRVEAAAAGRLHFDHDLFEQRAEAIADAVFRVDLPGIDVDRQSPGDTFRTFEQRDRLAEQFVPVLGREQR